MKNTLIESEKSIYLIPPIKSRTYVVCGLPTHTSGAQWVIRLVAFSPNPHVVTARYLQWVIRLGMKGNLVCAHCHNHEAACSSHVTKT